LRNDVLHRCAIVEIELDRGATDGIRVGGEEEDSDGHGAILPVILSEAKDLRKVEWILRFAQDDRTELRTTELK
jgi:hypothetical protein